MEDEQIVELFLARDEKAIRQVSLKYGNRLRSLSLRLTEDAQTAEECENDTYLQAWNLIPPHEPRTYLFAFLARITRNLSINRCMERSRLKRSAVIVELTAELEQCIPAPNDMMAKLQSEELGKAISAFLRTISQEKRVIFLRRYYYLDSIAAIAQQFGFSQSKVKVTLSRVNRSLRQYLIKEGYSL